jgi:hypothetical protein
MNAKMTITIPVDDIPQEVSRLLENISEKLKIIVDRTSNLTYNQDHGLVVSEIDDIRKQLSLIDMNYEDCYSVLLGFIKYQTDSRINKLENKNTQETANE